MVFFVVAVNGASFVKHLAACTDVESLSLGNCGYGFTNETAEKLRLVVPPSHPS